MNNKTQTMSFQACIPLIDKMVELYIKNAPLKSISKEEYANFMFYYSLFKERSTIEMSWIDFLLEEVQSWEQIKIEF